MSLVRYECKTCGYQQLAFDGEGRIKACCGEDPIGLPPDPTIAHATSGFMIKYQLDSLYTVQKLQDELAIEAEKERKLKAYHKFRQED